MEIIPKTQTNGDQLKKRNKKWKNCKKMVKSKCTKMRINEENAKKRKKIAGVDDYNIKTEQN